MVCLPKNESGRHDFVLIRINLYASLLNCTFECNIYVRYNWNMKPSLQNLEPLTSISSQGE